MNDPICSMRICRRNKPSGDALTTRLDSLRLKVGKALGYWFDFGDELVASDQRDCHRRRRSEGKNTRRWSNASATVLRNTWIGRKRKRTELPKVDASFATIHNLPFHFEAFPTVRPFPKHRLKRNRTASPFFPHSSA